MDSNRITGQVVGALAILLAVYAFVVTLSEFRLLEPRSRLAYMSESSAADIESLRDIPDRFRNELAWQPLNASICSELGRTHDWLSARTLPGKEDGQLQQAEQAYRCAIQRRPTDGLNWVDLAVVLNKAGRFGDEGYSALVNAMKLGRFEYSVQRRAIWLALANWYQLDDADRQMVVQMVTGAMDQQLGYVIRAVVLFDREDDLRQVFVDAGRERTLNNEIRKSLRRKIYPVLAD